MGSWVQVLVEVSAAEAELVADRLWSAGVAGIEERPGPDGGLVLVAGVDGAALTEVQAALGELGRAHEVVEVAADAGLDGWREFARAVTVGSLTIVPSWQDAPASSEADATGDVIRLDAGRSFGHGAHVTTRLALDLLQRVIRPGCEVLDVGAGSGVLSVAAAKLGAARVVAVDVALEAIDASRHNVGLNELADVVEVRPGSVDPGVGRFDVVVANIEAPILIELAEVIAGAVAPGGILVLSGFLEQQEGRVRASFAALQDRLRIEEDGWAALALAPHP